MTTTQQPLALKLAEAVKTHEHHPQYKFYGMVSDELIRLHARVHELESQLEAIGAGGVESLRKKSITRTVNAGALQMVINALRRDAAEGKSVRGEMADELEKVVE